MQSSPWRPGNEAETVGGEAVLLEWLAATRSLPLDGPAGLRDWARQHPASFRAAFAAFAGVAPDLADAACGWLLGAGLRPDDSLYWTGDPADPCLAGLTAIDGVRTADPARATHVLGIAPVWPEKPAAPLSLCQERRT